ncbi:MAG TPA: nucleotidyl transferase AbiEii/AbiGii toxin family protein [Gaiellaceae bacterium]|nr:nucleotidyl transferase AbiEii/AbiGii toxin family protein [Gaiellaceae bacterium]
MSAPVVERDYVLTHVIESLVRNDPPSGLVFKGGTALRLCFYDDFRYSADLDFSLVGLDRADALAALREALGLCAETIGLPMVELPDADSVSIHYLGPLGRERQIKVDLADDELVVATTDRAVIARYSDQLTDRPALRAYTLEEVAGEKLRCVLQRLLCRDISDLHRLLVREGVDVDESWARFVEKARFKSLQPAAFAERLDAREPQYRRRWEQELADLERDLRPFDEVVRQLRRALRGHL